MDPSRPVSSCYRPTLSAYIALAFQIVLATVGTACVQFLQRRIPDFELGGCRYSAQLLVTSTLVYLTGSEVRISRPFRGWLAILTTAHIFFNTSLYAGASFIALSPVITTTYVSRLISVAVITHFICKKSVGKMQLLGIVVCIVGIIMVRQPWLMYNQKEGDDMNITSTCHDVNVSDFQKDVLKEGANGESRRILLGHMLTVLSGISYAVYVVTATYALSAVNTVVQAMWVAFFGVPVSVITAFYFEEPIIPTDPRDILLILCHGFSASVTAILAIYVCRILGALKTTCLQNLAVVMFLIFQYTLMKEVMPGHRNWLEVFGALLTMLGAILAPAFHWYIEWRTGKGPQV